MAENIEVTSISQPTEHTVPDARFRFSEVIFLYLASRSVQVGRSSAW